MGVYNIEVLIAKKDVKGLIEALKDKNYIVRQKAAEALGNIGDKRAIIPLEQNLKDKSWLVRTSAQGSLNKINTIEKIKKLLPKCPICQTHSEYRLDGIADDYLCCLNCGAKWYLRPKGDWLGNKLSEGIITYMRLEKSPKEAPIKYQEMIEKIYPLEYWQNLAQRSGEKVIISPARESKEKDKSLVTKEEIVGYINTYKSEFLFFTSSRVIVSKKSSKALWGGRILAGALGGWIADSIYQDLKVKKLSGLSPDKILMCNRHNFAISYSKLISIEISRKVIPIGSWEIKIETGASKYTFDWPLGIGRDVREYTKFLVPLLSEKFSIRD